MKVEELKQALRLLTKVLADPRLGPSQEEQLRCAKRELTKVLQSGKLEGPRVFRAVEMVAMALADSFDIASSR